MTFIEPETNEKQGEENPPTDRHFEQVQRIILLLLGFVLLIYLLREFATVLTHVLIAVFLVYLILPAYTWLKRIGVPAVLSFCVIVVVTLAGLAGVGFIVYEEAYSLTRPERIETLRRTLDEMIDETALYIPGLDAQSAKEVVDREAENARRGVRRTLGSLFVFVSQAFIVLIFLIFLLAEQADLPRRIRQGFEHERAEYILVVIEKINHSISRYIAAKTFACFLTGVATTITLFVFGVQNALLWGFIAFLSHYIPYVGPVVAVTIPALLSIPHFDDLWMPLLLLFLLNAWQTIIGYILEPILFGDRLNLSPFVILVSLSFWWSIWGIVGMILAVPLVAVFKIICENIPQLKPIASLLSKA